MTSIPSSYRVRNWTQFQHYKDRNPPWIKLHFALLASEDWVMLDDASKLLAVVCMLVASRNEGMVPNKPAYLKRVAYLDHVPDLSPLILCGFLENPQAPDSSPQADARPETEQSREETEEEKKEGADALALSPILDQSPDTVANLPTDWTGSDEERFWRLVPTAKEKGIARSQMGQLANALNGAFDQGLGIMADAMAARNPRPYLAAIINKMKTAPPSAQDPAVPTWVADARGQGYPVDREGPHWRMGAALYGDDGEQVGA